MKLLEKFKKRNHRVLVRNGVDIKQQLFGYKKGDYFTGGTSTGTVLINQRRSNWRIVIDNLNTKKRYSFLCNNALWIGRTKADQNHINKYTISYDDKVSKNHCIIYPDRNALWIKDMGSANHTYLNQRLVKDREPLHNGDIIRVGTTYLKIHITKV